MAVALTIIPFLSSRILKEHSAPTEGNIFLRLLKKAISKTYSVILDKALNRPVITVIIAAVIFAGALIINSGDWV